jgi:hypothetical protein
MEHALDAIEFECGNYFYNGAYHFRLLITHV